MGFFKSLLSLLMSLFRNKPSVPETPLTTGIDWTKVSENVTTHFTVGDCLALHAWNRLANEKDGITDEVKTNIVTLCNKMEQIRAVLGCPINVHCVYRSPEYNTQVIKGIPNDVHSFGQAIDFDCNGCKTIDEVHSILEPLLEQYGLRMERSTPTWIHLDIHPVKNARYFNA